MSSYHSLSRREFFRRGGFAAAFPFVPDSYFAPFVKATRSQLPAVDLDKIRELLRQSKPNIWLFTGDSITHGAKHTHGMRSYPEVFAERIRWELQRMHDIIINTGISGNTTRDILDEFEWRIGQFRPQVVSLMIGTNDCAKPDMTTSVFRKNLSLLIEKIRELSAVPVLHTPNTIIEKKAPERADLSTFIPVIQKVAEEQKVVLIDNWSFWKGQSADIVNRAWLNDPLHPNGVGQLEIARQMFRGLSIFNAEDPTCGGKFYEGDH